MNKAGFTTHTLVPGIFLTDKLEFFYTFYGLIAMPFLTMPIASHIFDATHLHYWFKAF